MIESTPRRITAIALTLAVTLVIGLVSPSGAPPAADAGGLEGVADGVSAAGSGRTLNVDVAEDGTRFVYDEAPRLPNDYPAYGNAFVTQGYIYPAGTLTDSNGVAPDGGPEFPDMVIGEWTCWGYFIGDGADTTDGPWVVTTQVFEFDGDVPGEHTIVTIGSETPAGAGPAVRAVTGGSGRFSVARGQVTQVTLGHNASDGVNAQFAFDLQAARQRPESLPAAATGVSSVDEASGVPH